jgi:hypothetical protein
MKRQIAIITARFTPNGINAVARCLFGIRFALLKMKGSSISLVSDCFVCAGLT